MVYSLLFLVSSSLAHHFLGCSVNKFGEIFDEFSNQHISKEGRIEKT